LERKEREERKKLNNKRLRKDKNSGEIVDEEVLKNGKENKMKEGKGKEEEGINGKVG